MTPERGTSKLSDQLTEIVLEVLEAPPEQRAEVLDRRCGDDTSARAAVERAVASQTAAAVTLPAPLLPSDPAAGAEDVPIGTQIGPYQITRSLGRGGMGTVYLATRTEGYKSTVAIKVIQRGIRSAAALQRFRDEIQFQAALGKHPFIAALLDAGETEQGIPYFVMEYVEGMHIDRYCEHHRLPLRNRLRLFQRVCEAVQFAHQNTVIHRDLKPSNILITADGSPRLIDFGIARLFNPQLGFQSDDPSHSEQRALTPAYASPEQATGKPITTAADIYSLGVILYELLTGVRPHHVDSDSPDEWARVVSERAPKRPSDMVREQVTANNGQTATVSLERANNPSLPRLQRTLRGDLDRIVLMALEREPAARYLSASQFAADIEHHLSGEPVLAGPDSFLYRTRKFVARHRWGVAAAILLLLSLAAGVVGTTAQWRYAESQRIVAVGAAQEAQAAREAEQLQRERAETEAETAQAIIDYLNNLLAAAHPDQMGHETTVREAVDAAAEQVESAFGERPAVEAAVRRTLGTTYRGLSLLDEAEQQFRSALELQLETEGPESLDTLETMDLLAGALRSRAIDGDLEAAITLRRQVVATRTRLQGADHPQTAVALGNLANVLSKQGLHEEALQRYRDAYQVLVRSEGADPYDLIVTRYNIASTLHDLEQLPEAAAELERLRVSLLEIEEPTTTRALQVTNELATVLSKLSEDQRAETLFRSTLEGRRTVLGESHLHTLSTMRRLSRLLVGPRANYAEAIPLLKESVELHEKRFPRGAGLTFGVRQSLAQALLGAGQVAEAERVLVETHTVLSEERGSKHRYALQAAADLADFYEGQGNADRASHYRGLSSRSNTEAAP